MIDNIKDPLLTLDDGMILFKEALVFIIEKQWNKAEDNLVNALTIFESNSHLSAQADTHYNLGQIYYTKGEVNKAIDHYLKASPLYEQKINPEEKLQILG